VTPPTNTGQPNTRQPALFAVEPLPARRRRAPRNPAVRLAEDAWTADCLAAIEAMARSGRTFQAFDVAQAHNLPDPPHHNAWGRTFALAHRLGIIVPVHAARSTRRTTCGSLTWVWEASPELLDGDTLAAA
jgi:hypothetical protein